LSKRYKEFFVIDILVAIEKIKRYHAPFTDADTFYHDDKSFDATMRELQIIGEATKHLLQEKFLNEDYRIIVDFRNVIVHEYFGIDPDEIWDIIQHELPSFEKSIYVLLALCDQTILLDILQQSEELYHGQTLRFVQQLSEEIKTTS
jgi:uncharacterized protein with HEPN domain